MGGFDWVFSLARIAATSLEGAKRVLLANVEGIEGETANRQIVYSALGWFGRPLDPDANGAADALCARVEDGLIPFAMRDPRLSVKTNGKKGELGIAHYDGGFVSLKRNVDNDGTDITLYAPKADGSKASVISIDTSDANSNITIMHDTGVSVQLADGKILLTNADGDVFIEVNGSQVVINGNVKVNGAMVVGSPALGSPVALALPITSWGTAMDIFAAAVVAKLTNPANPIPVAPLPLGVVASTSLSASP
jgi:hypothetical protein